MTPVMPVMLIFYFFLFVHVLATERAGNVVAVEAARVGLCSVRECSFFYIFSTLVTIWASL